MRTLLERTVDRINEEFAKQGNGATINHRNGMIRYTLFGAKILAHITSPIRSVSGIKKHSRRQ